MNKTIRFILLFIAAMLIGFFFVSVVSADIGGPPTETPRPTVIITPEPTIVVTTPEPTAVITPEPTVEPTAEPTVAPTVAPTPEPSIPTDEELDTIIADLIIKNTELINGNAVLIENNNQLLQSLVLLGTVFSAALLMLTIFTYSIFRMVRSLMNMFDWI